MDKSGIVWATFWVVVVICISVCITVGSVRSMGVTVKFIEHGYTRTTLPGVNYGQWVKE